MRDVANEAECSVGMVTHYFSDKEELLVSALATATDACHRRLLQRAMARPLRLRDVLAGSLPLDEQSRLEWAVWLSYWGAVVASEALAEQQRRHYQTWHQIVESAILSLDAEGSLAAGVDASSTADFLMSVCDGLGVRATIDPLHWPSTRLLRHLDCALTLVTPNALGVAAGEASQSEPTPTPDSNGATSPGRGVEHHSP